ncbi:MAG: flavin reductase [Pseudomonadota bacterium]
MPASPLERAPPSIPMSTPVAPIEEGNPTEDSRAFRRCLGQFTTGVTVITACHGEQMVGMSVNSFSALSLEPPLVLWSIRRESGSLPVFREASHFAVNVLAADQVSVSSLFASPKEDKFAQSRWSLGPSGAPLLAGTIAQMECRLEQVLEGGDHLILVGRVERYARFVGEPLLFTQGRYAITQEHPGAEQTPSPAVVRSECPQDAIDGSLLRLLHYASNQMSSCFDAHRMIEGLNVAQFRFYGWLRTQSRSLEQLKQLTYLGSRDADDTVAVLTEKGHLSKDASGILQLTPAGRERAEAIARRVAAFEADLFQGLSEEDLATTRRVLGALAQRSAQAAVT